MALEDINFELDGNIISILGPNGSGKTTLLSIISGLRYPSRGYLKVENFIPYMDREKFLKKVRFSFGSSHYGFRNRVIEVFELAEIDLKNSFVDRVINLLGGEDYLNKRVHELSSGQTQILSLLVTLCQLEDGIAILDEPFSYLDVRFRGIFLEEVRRRGNIVFTTHVIEEAELFSDHIVILNDGRVSWYGETMKLFKDNVFELYTFQAKKNELYGKFQEYDMSLLADFGLGILAKVEDINVLNELVAEGYLLGFRKAGARWMLYEDDYKDV